MAPVTEVVVLDLQPYHDPKFIESMRNIILAQSGALRVRYSKQHEDPSKLALFVDWEDLSAHSAFAATSQYQPFLALVTANLVSEHKPKPYHVAFETVPPTVLDNVFGEGVSTVVGNTKVAEVLHAYFPAEEGSGMTLQQEALVAVQSFVDATKKAAAASEEPIGLSGEDAQGWAIEDVEFRGENCRALVAVFGWDSLEAHMKYRETAAFKESIGILRNMNGLKGMQVYHVRNEVFEKKSA